MILRVYHILPWHLNPATPHEFYVDEWNAIGKDLSNLNG